MNTQRPLISWALYDWANSAYATTVMAGFFPLFFKEYYSAGTDVILSTAQLGLANSLSSLIIILLGPLLGAIADAGSLRKRFLFIFSYLGILMSASLSLIGKGAWEMAVFVYVLGNIGFMMSNTFYDAMLPSVAERESMDAVSGLGFALGYLGGGILFGLNAAMVLYPGFFGFENSASAVKASFVTVAVWWALFSLPLLFFVKEKRGAVKKDTVQIVFDGYRRVTETFKKITRYKGLLLFLSAYWLYIDGVDTIIKMAVDYGIAIGFDPSELIMALLMVQFIGFPATLLLSKLAQKWDTKKTILLSIGIYFLITVLAAQVTRIYEFYFLAVMIAIVQGGDSGTQPVLLRTDDPAGSGCGVFRFLQLSGKIRVDPWPGYGRNGRFVYGEFTRRYRLCWSLFYFGWDTSFLCR